MIDDLHWLGPLLHPAMGDPPRILSESFGFLLWRLSPCLIRWRWRSCPPPAFTQGAKILADPFPLDIGILATARNLDQTYER